MAATSARTSAIFCLFLFISVAAIAAETMEPTETNPGQRIAEMFQVGVVSNPRALQESQRIYESLSSSSGNDPRIDYAHGLVLLKLLKTKEAQAQFLIATRRPGLVYRPAWQAMIWLHFNAKSYDEGYERLIEYTRLILDPTQFPLDLQHDEIYWIGRLMCALELMPNSPQSQESWTQADKRLTDQLGVEFINVYIDGKEDMRIRNEMIEDKIRRDQQKLEAQKAVKREKELQRKSKLLEATGENAENLKRSSNEAKETQEEDAAVFKKQTQRAEKDLAFLERRGTILTAEMFTLDQQINLLQQTIKNQNTPANAQRLNALQNQRFIKDLEFQRITILAQEVSTNARQMMEQRAESLEQTQRESGERAEKEKNNETVKARTLRQVAELKKAEAKALGAVEKQLAARTLRNFIDFDLTAERDKVLDSFGIKAAKK